MSSAFYRMWGAVSLAMFAGLIMGDSGGDNWKFAFGFLAWMIVPWIMPDWRKFRP